MLNKTIYIQGKTSTPFAIVYRSKEIHVHSILHEN